MLSGEKIHHLSKKEKLSELTQGEKAALIEEVAERMKDIVYLHAWEKAKEAINKALKYGFVDSNESIEITYTIKFIENDFRQIVARLRRKEANLK